MPAHPFRLTVQLIEEALALLRQLPPTAFLRYLLSATPWTLLLWFFIFHLRQDAAAESRALPMAGLAALAYLLYRGGCIRFCHDLYTALTGSPARPAPSLLLRQLTLHGWLLLPLLPAATCPPLLPPLLFLQGALSAARTPDSPAGLLRLLVRNLRQALWLALLLLPALALLVLNLCILFRLLPELVLSLSGWSVIPTFPRQTLAGEGLALLLAMPLFNTLFLACLCLLRFHAESTETGEACRLALVRSGLLKKILPLLLLACACLADTPPTPPQLQQDIRIILRDGRYNWQEPSAHPNPDAPERTIMPPLQTLAHALCDAGDWINRTVIDRLARLLPQSRRQPRTGTSPPTPAERGNGLLLFIAAAMILTLATALWIVRRRLRRQNQPAPAARTAAIAAPTPDLTAPGLHPEQLPAEAWQELARLMTRQECWKAACRAWFMAQICALAQRRLLHLAQHKSNRDYLRELQSRGAPAHPYQHDFQASQQDFDALWYGCRKASPELTRLFQDRCQRSTP